MKFNLKMYFEYIIYNTIFVTPESFSKLIHALYLSSPLDKSVSLEELEQVFLIKPIRYY